VGEKLAKVSIESVRDAAIKIAAAQGAQILVK
jgi:hypothetical protein